MKQLIIKYLKYSLIFISGLWFVVINLLSFASYDFYIPEITSVFKQVPSELFPCHTRAQGRSNYGMIGMEDPNRAFFNLLPVTQMDYMRGYTGEDIWYIEYRQYFLFIPIGIFRFPCAVGEIFP